MKVRKIVSITLMLMFVFSLGIVTAAADNTRVSYSLSMSPLGSNTTNVRAKDNSSSLYTEWTSGNTCRARAYGTSAAIGTKGSTSNGTDYTYQGPYYVPNGSESVVLVRSTIYESGVRRAFLHLTNNGSLSSTVVGRWAADAT